MTPRSSVVKKYVPLIGMIALAIIISVIRMACLSMWTIHAFMNNFMGSFFILFGSFKIINLPAFARAYAMYDVVAKKTIWYAYLYPFIEIALGVAYFMQWRPLLVNICTFVLMSISALGVVLALQKKEKIRCACLGDLFEIPMTYVTLAEDLVMAAMALFMILYRP